MTDEIFMLTTSPGHLIEKKNIVKIAFLFSSQ